ncbi:MAG: hypothetical protein HYZ65_05135 [Burkholderiales bacterium]|nr:hypothetical protein [Burkholderiales bacterium]
MQLSRLLLAFTLGGGYAAAAGVAVPPTPATTGATVELPLLAGWYQGAVVHYVSTDISDQDMAKPANLNYTPRLQYALRAPQPGQPSAVDRVYKFTNFKQGSVFASAPEPLGSGSASAAYTPLWVVYLARWREGSAPQLLRSEEEVLDAEEKKWLELTPTAIVINCPIVYSGKDGGLGGSRVHGLK